MPSRNLYKCKQIVCCNFFILFTLSVQCCCCMFTCLSLFLYTDVVVDCLLLYPFFILMLLLYFCLFIDHVNKLIMFVFGTFLCHFNNTIFIFVTIYTYIYIPFTPLESIGPQSGGYGHDFKTPKFILDRSVRFSFHLTLNHVFKR